MKQAPNLLRPPWRTCLSVKLQSGGVVYFYCATTRAHAPIRGLFLRRRVQLKRDQFVECPAVFVPVAMRETGMEGALNGAEEEVYTGADREPSSTS